MDVPGAVAGNRAEPTSIWQKLLTSLPVGLTVLATAFAGLSSSEMTQAMYHRSLAAQHQSKAGDQWSFFQAKRTRGTTLETTAELLQSLGNPPGFDPSILDSQLAKLLGELENSGGKKEADASPPANLTAGAITAVKSAQEQLKELRRDDSLKTSLSHLLSSTLPEMRAPGGVPTPVLMAIVAIRERKTEQEAADLIRNLKYSDIDDAIRRAEQDADAFDKACALNSIAIKKFDFVFDTLNIRALRELDPGQMDPALQSLLGSLEAQQKGYRLDVLKFESRRYQYEAALNRNAAEAYEVRVRRSGAESDRFRERSKLFFYSMLMAQAGVVIASLALAGTQRKSLWLLAALAGLVALAFSGYVYLTL